MKTHTHTQTNRPQFLGLTTALWAIKDEETLQQSCSTNTGISFIGLTDLGGTQANNLQILMDITACAGYRRGHDRKVGKWENNV